MNVYWTVIRKIHAVRDDQLGVSRANRPLGKTVCGKAIIGDTTDARPQGDTCESCLRIIAPK